VPPSKQDELRKELSHIASKAYKKLFNLIDEFEENVPFGTHPEIGFSLFSFNNDTDDDPVIN